MFVAKRRKMELNSLERGTVSCVLQEAVHQLAVVQTGVPTSKFLFRPIMQRINDCGSNKIYNRETWELTEMAYKLLEPVSLNNIRYFTESVLEALRLEVLSAGTMHSIEDMLQLEHECRAEGSKLVEETLKYSTEVAALQSKIKEITLNSCEEVNQKDVQLAMLQDDLLDLQYHKQVSLGFTEQRIGAKLGQVSLWLRDHEHSLAQNIDFNIVACDLQDRVHVEILNYLDCIIHDLKGLVEYWIERSKTEMAEMNVRLNKLQQIRSEQSNQLQNLSALYKKHQEDMKSYCEERMAREHKQEMQLHISEMATKIQAWWRGTMVRRHLGPFKVDKKKKPKDKPKKKK
ncbi:dynein regulatory complex protein 9-like [Homalodisca vitripennis]|uniref:dynein regulatory complex protein 9-like n=1 Tax=Homalodisca vitripennis TaxID=197043 RepID=UPI001EEC5BAC|nr:dynein regulatory complex protein 9-like [Homalodisca vitripennis]